MFETSSVNGRKRKFHPPTFLISAALHLVAIGFITFVTVWDVESPATPPDQITRYTLSPAPPIPPPPKIRKGRPDGSTDRIRKETKKEPDVVDRAPREIPEDVEIADEQRDASEMTGSDEPLGHPEGDERGDPEGTLDGELGSVGDESGGGFIEDKTYVVGNGVIAPVVVHRVDPVYPPLLQRMGLSGVAIIECVISRSGQLTDIRVIQSSHPLFAKSAEAAVREWRFRPGTLRGKPVSTQFVFTVNFSVER